MCTCFLITLLISQGPVISSFWCFPFNCWNKHLILGKVHRNTEAFDFPKIFLIKIFTRIFQELKFLLTSMPMFSWHVWIWGKRCLPWKILLRPYACLLCKCLFVCFLSYFFFFFFLVVWDIVSNGIYATDFSISFESLLCIIATAFCASNKKGKMLKVAICWVFTSHQKKGTPMLPKSCMTIFS